MGTTAAQVNERHVNLSTIWNINLVIYGQDSTHLDRIFLQLHRSQEKYLVLCAALARTVPLPRVPLLTDALVRSCHLINKFIPLLRGHRFQETMLPYPAVRPAYSHNPDRPRPPEAGAPDARNDEAHDGEQHPVLPHPEDRLRVLPVPAVALDDVEEAPAVSFVVIRHQDPHALRGRSGRADVLLPDHG
jgi:hypothetical protein